jgi:hypothetical protein
MPFRPRLPIRATLFAFAVLAVVATPAQASFILLDNPNQFSGNEPVVTFQGINAFEIITPAKALGVDFRYAGTGGGIQAAFDPTPPREFGPQEGTILNQFMFGTAGIQITFPQAVNRVGFELFSNPNLGGVLGLSLFDGTTQVESFTIANRATSPALAQSYLFYGFQTTESFDRVVLVGPGDGRFSLDNVRFEQAGATAVPEPSSLALFGVGAIALGIWRWRRKRGATEPIA